MADGENTQLRDRLFDMTEPVDPEGGRNRGRRHTRDESGWIGFTDHYWMTTLIPDPGCLQIGGKYDERRDIYQTEAVQDARELAPGATVRVSTRLFAGAKEWATIRATKTTRASYRNFLDSIDWGWFFFLTKPIFAVLHWLNALIGNMGWAIIGLTIVIKLLLFPLAYKSYASMAKMRELQPQMEKIKEQAATTARRCSRK